MEEKPGVGVMRVLVDAIRIEGAGLADQSVDLIPVLQQELGQERAILAGDSCDQSLAHAIPPGPSRRRPLQNSTCELYLSLSHRQAPIGDGWTLTIDSCVPFPLARCAHS